MAAAVVSQNTSIVNNVSVEVRNGRKVLKQRYITPADVDIVPTSPNHKIHAHHAIPVNQPPIPIPNEYKDGRTELDGFYLLEKAGIHFPEDLQAITLCDKNLATVVDDDLTYFTELLYVDVSENRLPLYPFGALPKLRELRLTCNHIVDLGELYGFSQLLYLDLSYNSLHPDTVNEIMALPVLKELDLSGNNLKTLPPDLSGFGALEKIILEYNKIDDNGVFMSLSTIPQIRYVDLSHNFLSKIPKECTDYNGFKFLEVLDISFNFFNKELHIYAILHMPRLIRLILYSNPVLGPTGEDPLCTYIEDLVEESMRIRSESQTNLPDVEFVTELPRRRILKKGQPLGRFALYRDFSVVQVEEASRGEGTARQWKQKGIMTMFGEAMSKKALVPNNPATLPASSSLPDLTFLTSVAGAGGGVGGEGVMGVRGGLNMDSLADDVMGRVAGEMGLLDKGDFTLFEQLAKMPTTVVELEARIIGEKVMKEERAQERHEREQASLSSSASLLEGEGVVDGGGDEGDAEGASPSLFMDSDEEDEDAQDGQAGEANIRGDRLPASLFTPHLSPPPSLKPHAQPVQLKTAMLSLQRALRNPLTDYNYVPPSWGSGGGRAGDHTRATRSSRIRQLPRIPLATPTHDEDGGDGAKGAGKGGRASPPVQRKRREEAREKTLQQIEEVLGQLNTHTMRMIQGAGGAGSAPDGAGGAGATSHIRQHMEQMSSFAHKPKGGVGKLMNMVNSIVEEFQA